MPRAGRPSKVGRSEAAVASLVARAPSAAVVFGAKGQRTAVRGPVRFRLGVSSRPGVAQEVGVSTPAAGRVRRRGGVVGPACSYMAKAGRSAASASPVAWADLAGWPAKTADRVCSGFEGAAGRAGGGPRRRAAACAAEARVSKSGRISAGAAVPTCGGRTIDKVAIGDGVALANSYWLPHPARLGWVAVHAIRAIRARHADDARSCALDVRDR